MYVCVCVCVLHSVHGKCSIAAVCVYVCVCMCVRMGEYSVCIYLTTMCVCACVYMHVGFCLGLSPCLCFFLSLHLSVYLLFVVFSVHVFVCITVSRPLASYTHTFIRTSTPR